MSEYISLVKGFQFTRDHKYHSLRKGLKLSKFSESISVYWTS